MNKTSITALMSAFGRAYHTQNVEHPIFADTKVRELMTDEEYSMIANYILSGVDFFAPDKKTVSQTARRHLNIWLIHRLRLLPLLAPHFVRMRSKHRHKRARNNT